MKNISRVMLTLVAVSNYMQAREIVCESRKVVCEPQVCHHHYHTETVVCEPHNREVAHMKNVARETANHVKQAAHDTKAGAQVTGQMVKEDLKNAKNTVEESGIIEQAKDKLANAAQAAKDTAIYAGHAAKETAISAGHATKEAAINTGTAIKNTATTLGHATKEGAKAFKDTFVKENA